MKFRLNLAATNSKKLVPIIRKNFFFKISLFIFHVPTSWTFGYFFLLTVDMLLAFCFLFWSLRFKRSQHPSSDKYSFLFSAHLINIYKLADCSWGQTKGSLFNNFYIKVWGRAQLLSMNCSTLPLIHTL